jgi:hypothetical protein
MNVQQGNPPGYERKNRNYKTDGTRIQEKQQQSLEELYRSVPAAMVKGTPIQYGDDGLPLVDDPEQFPEQNQNPAMVEQQNNQDPVAAKFFAPRQAAQQPRQKNQPQQTQQQSMSQGSTQYHPILKRMLNVFGLKKNSRHVLELVNEEVGSVKYTMTLVTEELQSWAMLESKNKHLTNLELAGIYVELLFGCCSVIAIDDIPLWQVFNVQVTDTEYAVLQEDPLEMSPRLRKSCARLLADLLWTETVPIGEKLIQFYHDKVLSKKIQSSLDKEILDKVRYVCPLDGCENYEFFKPEMENGVEKNYFCKFHGVQLVKTIDILKELDVPLA